MRYGNIENPGTVDTLWQVVGDSGELSSAVSTYTFSNLDGDTDIEYHLIVRFVNNASGQTGYKLRFNADSGSNYGQQTIRGGASTASANRDDPRQSITLADFNTGVNEVAFGSLKIYAKSGNERTAVGILSADISGTTVSQLSGISGCWSNTADNMTSMVITPDDANGIGIGSRLILLRKIALTDGRRTGEIDPQGTIYGSWQLVSETTLSSAVSTYDFTGLNGDTDTIYKLIVRLVNGDNNQNVVLQFNSTAGTSYGYQLLKGSSSTASASRTTAHSYILLTDEQSGAVSNLASVEALIFAKQNYVRTALVKSCGRISGTTVSDVHLIGGVFNDTSTEITSLQVDGTTNGLAIGTHLELWRLNL